MLDFITGGPAISIRLENPQAVYFAGQEVAGVTVVGVKPEGLKARNISVELEGKARVHWTEQHTTGTGDNRHTETRHYTSEEKYFESSVSVYMNNTGEEVLPSGDHSYPFRFTLPQNLPSSFEGKIGWVRYWVKVKVDRPWAFDSKEKLFFTVISVVDLNDMPHTKENVTLQNSKNFCCLCCKHGPLSTVMMLNQSGYAPGEVMRVTAEIDNKSDVTVDCVEAEVKQKMNFYACGKRKSRSFTLAKLCGTGEVPPGETFSWNGHPLKIPPLPPSGLKYCTIIDIDYWLELKVVPSGPHLNLTLSTPLTIGTIPFRERFQLLYAPGWQPQAGDGFAQPPGQQPQAGFSAPYPPPPSAPPSAPLQPEHPAPFAPTAPPPPFSGAYPDLPPPAYEEAVADGGDNVKDDDDDDNTNANWNYRPKYLTWKSLDESQQQ